MLALDAGTRTPPRVTSANSASLVQPNSTYTDCYYFTSHQWTLAHALLLALHQLILHPLYNLTWTLAHARGWVLLALHQLILHPFAPNSTYTDCYYFTSPQWTLAHALLLALHQLILHPLCNLTVHTLTATTSLHTSGRWHTHSCSRYIS
ncbi:hypothetical protein J6590_068505 [Homalodisca vitripennis]|nr:hypothetical protein J6590_068505 [Homalodisca vitripennis]